MYPVRILSDKGSSPTELGVVRPKTANAIGLLPVKKFPVRLSERAQFMMEVTRVAHLPIHCSDHHLCGSHRGCFAANQGSGLGGYLWGPGGGLQKPSWGGKNPLQCHHRSGHRFLCFRYDQRHPGRMSGSERPSTASGCLRSLA